MLFQVFRAYWKEKRERKKKKQVWEFALDVMQLHILLYILKKKYTVNNVYALFVCQEKKTAS